MAAKAQVGNTYMITQTIVDYIKENKGFTAPFKAGEIYRLTSIHPYNAMPTAYRLRNTQRDVGSFLGIEELQMLELVQEEQSS